MAISLTKTTRDGKPYQRRTEIQQLIIELEELTPDSLVQRATDYDNPIPMEALVYFLRQNTKSVEVRHFKAMFEAFFTRLEASLKAALPDYKYNEASDIRQEIMLQFAEMLAREKNGEERLLAYYEINFNHALVNLKTSVLRKMGPAKNKDPLDQSTSLTSISDDEIDISSEVEVNATEFFEDGLSKLEDLDFRSKLVDAIKDLPTDEQQVVTLMLYGMQIEAEDSNTHTISKTLGCTSRTVRNRRNRAYTKLQKALLSEEEL